MSYYDINSSNVDLEKTSYSNIKEISNKASHNKKYNIAEVIYVGFNNHDCCNIYKCPVCSSTINDYELNRSNICSKCGTLLTGISK